MDGEKTSVAYSRAEPGVGASLAPYLATWLARNYGLAAVGGYLALSAVITILALWGMGRVSPETEL